MEPLRDRQLGNSRQEVQAHAELGRGPWPARGEPIVVPVEINQRLDTQAKCLVLSLLRLTGQRAAVKDSPEVPTSRPVDSELEL